MIPVGGLNDHDEHASENVMHEEGLDKMLTGFFGDENNDDNNEHMVESNDDNKGNYHQCNVDDNNLLKDSIKKAKKTLIFKSSASRISKLACTLIVL